MPSLLPARVLAGLLIGLGGAPAFAEGPTGPPVDLLVPFAVEGEPAAWARSFVSSRLSPLERLRGLSTRLLTPHGRPIEDRPGTTGSAAQVFTARRANCVGYANLFVGLARELGVPAYFVLVEDLPTGTALAARPSLRVAETHLAAAWGAAEHVRVFDLAGEADGRELRARPITDLTAIAVFYSNRGVEALLAGHTAHAVAWLREAVELEPSALPFTWTNLGVALRRAGDVEGANRAYQRALELDPAARDAAANLAALLALRGRNDEAADLLATATSLSRLDSLSALHLARERLLAGEIEAARGLYRRALDLSQRPAR